MKKKVLFVVLGLIIAVVGAVWIIGSRQPESHRATVHAAFEKTSAADVWKTIAAFETWPSWNRNVDEMIKQESADGRTVWLARGKWGDMPAEIIEWTPPTRMVTRIPDDADLGFEGTWTYVVEPAGEGATLTITEDGRVSSPLFRFMALVFFDETTTMSQFQIDLGKRLGEDITPRRVP